MPSSGYFYKLFAVDGDRTVTPDAADPSGYVSYDLGWTGDYQLPLGNISRKVIDRSEMNGLIYDLTAAIQQYQQKGVPNFITTTMNGGSPFSYSIGDRVVSGGVTYTSLANTNTTTPPGASWGTGNPVALGGTGLSSITAYNLMIGAGTSALTLLAPSATSGVPLISQGASSDPAYGVAVVAGGGSGRASNTAYAVVCGGTTSTGAQQSIASVGTSGQVLTSNGAGALPTMQTLTSSSTGGAGIVQLATNAQTTTGTSTSLVAPISAMKYHEGIIKAWVNFNGSGTVAIRDSYNVSSITDNGVGSYTVNFTNNFASTNYGCVGFIRDLEDVLPGGFLTAELSQTKTVSAMGITATIGSSAADSTEIFVMFIGDI